MKRAIVFFVFFLCTLIASAQERPKRERFFSISSTTANFKSEGGTRIFTVTSSDSWKITSQPQPWGHLTVNGDKITLGVDANNETVSRSSTFELSSGENKIVVSIIQEGRFVFSVSQTKLSFDSSGGTKSIVISSNLPWEIGTGTTSWRHLTRSGNELKVRVDRNSYSSSRSDWFTIKSGTEEKKIYISQSGYISTSLSVSADKIEFDSSGGTKRITVNSNANWILVDQTTSMCSVSKSGDNVVTINCLANRETSSRSTSFLIKTTEGNVERHISITQAGEVGNTSSSRKLSSVSKLEVDKTELSLSAGSGRVYIHVNTDAENFTVSLLPSWCKVSQYSTFFVLEYSANNSFSARSDWFNVTAGNKKVRVDITQSGKEYQPSVYSGSNSNYYRNDKIFRIGFDVSLDMFISEADTYGYENDTEDLYGFGFGIRARLGRYDQLLNLIGGVRYVIGGGYSGLLAPIILNMNILRSEDLGFSMYLGAGCELGISGDFYNDMMFQLGLCGKKFDLSMYVKPSNEVLGAGFTFYF